MSGVIRYRIRHETVYDYGDNVAHSHQLWHLSPRDGARQICHSRTISLTPERSARREDMGAFGNLVTRQEYAMPHVRLEVLPEVAVEVSPPRDIRAAMTQPWETPRDALIYSGQPMDAAYLDACRFCMESSYVRVKQAFTDYAAECFSTDRPVLVAAEAPMHKMHRDFSDEPGTTKISTSVLEAFEARRRVCQDISHIKLASLRSRGFAARYVSGYLRSITPPGADAALLGADASHA